MLRTLIATAGALAVWAAGAPLALAQTAGRFEAHPGVSGVAPSRFPYGPGLYLSWYKLPLCWLLFLLWVRTVDWINQDGQRLKLPYRRWNQVAFFSFMTAFVLLLVLPFRAAFFVGFPIMLLAYVVPLAMYVAHRNGTVPEHEKVFTAAHLRFWLSQRARPLGIKIAAQAPVEEGPPLELSARGGATERDDNVNLLTARQSPGFDLARLLLAGAVSQRAGAIMLDYTQQSVAVRYQIDGVWHNTESQDRPSGDALLAVLKTISALNPAERRARQLGTFGAEYEKKVKYTCKLASQGTKTGERVLLQFDDGGSKKLRLADLGMREKMQEQWKGLLEEKKGLLLVAAPPGGGLSTLLWASVAAKDRFLRGVVAIEEASRRDLEVENVPVTTYDAAAGQTPAAVLPKLIREIPDAYVIADLADAESAGMLWGEIRDDRLVITSVRAKEAAEALLRLLASGMTAEQVAEAALGVMCGRLVRALCNTCKEAYAPPGQVLAQLGLPADRVEAFYRPPQPPADPKEICADCRGIGYRGRSGIFELLVANDQVRLALVNDPQVAAVRQAARQGGMRSLQEEGIVLVVKGVTSLAELIRVLKE